MQTESAPLLPASRSYVLRLVTVQVAGGVHLLYGEAVDLADGERVPLETVSKTVATASGGVTLTLTTDTISRPDLDAVVGGLESGHGQWAGLSFQAGPLIRRAATIVPVLHGLAPDDGSTLHPDGRFTYMLDELWDAEEATFDRLWETREFQAIGEAVQDLVGIALHQVSDRVGNFLIYDRLSSWRIDSQTDVRGPGRWVRAVSDGPSAGNLRMHVRVLDGHETVSERVVDLSSGGVSIPGADYTQVSYSLFSQDGTLLARSAGAVIGESVVSAGAEQTATVVTSTGPVPIIWGPWPGGSPTRRRIDGRKPWNSRARQRSVRNLKLRERATSLTYGANSHAHVTDELRQILRDRTREFVYVWDPYLDDRAVLDVLQWTHPQVPCRILCGSKSTPAALAALQAALHTFRTNPIARQVECKHRVRVFGSKIVTVYHDRFIITQDAAWMLGSSLNSIGRAPGSVIRLFDPDPLRWMFEDEWAASMQSPIVESIL